MDESDCDELTNYAYERGEGRHKHRWRHDYAGFRPGRRGPIGKCHRSITDEIATTLLQSGVVDPSPYEDAPAHPDQIFNVYRGIPYVAVPTRPGVSYHGYPWRGRMSRRVREALRQRASDQGTEALKRFERWLKQYSEG